MNRLTAFVISTILVAGAFLYSERSDAGVMGNGGMIVGQGEFYMWHLRVDNQIRACSVGSKGAIICTSWLK
jgi:hypothetical protein